MSDTLSPFATHSNRENVMLDYQRIVLAEMGIPLWVGHATPVQTIDLAQFEQENFTQQNGLKNDVTQENFTEQKLIEQPILTTQLVQDSIVDLAVNLAISSNSDTLADVEQLSENPLVKTESFPAFTYSLACMRVNRWLLLADNAYLSAHPDEQQLWQTIAHSMHAEQTMLNFPIVATHPSQPASQHMGDSQSAQMTFVGFVHSQLAKSENVAVGAVSPLPEVIENSSLSLLNIADIQRLPYLSEMLQDTRQKRQLWELIKK